VRTFDVAGVSIPKLGIGTYTLQSEAGAAAVSGGLRAGHRHVDTAEAYDNEAAVGEGIRHSGVPRDEIFVTSKCWWANIGAGDLERACEASLKRLGIDRLDLYLIHWPNPAVPLADSLKALNAVRERGLARAVGVSNFPVALLEQAAALSSGPLAVNQVEYQPYLSQAKVLAALARHGMGLTAYSPIAKGRVMDDLVIRRVADAHGVSPVVATLAWLIGQDNVIAIPKSASADRLAEHLKAYDVTLSAEERAAIDGLARPDGRIINPSFAPAWDD
jgi:diketogulonate reductase-like aldo/keto reductase